MMNVIDLAARRGPNLRLVAVPDEADDGDGGEVPAALLLRRPPANPGPDEAA